MQELLLIDKPVGITSFDVIRKLRRVLGVRKMGHAGTLDPLASGLLLVGVGNGTKRLAEYVKLDKEYEASILLGERRATGDMEGAVLEEAVVPQLSSAVLAETLAGMVGTWELPVSAYSAIKQDGVPLYRRVRAGEGVEPPIRAMRVMKAEYLGHEYTAGRCTVHVRFGVGSGTYIRSLAEEFGRRLGYPATLAALRRTKVGDFSVEDAEAIV